MGLLVVLSLFRPCSMGWEIKVRIWVLPSSLLVRIFMLDILTSTPSDGDLNFFLDAVADLFALNDGKHERGAGYF